MMKSFVVIGLGRFGKAVARELSSLGNQVLAIDIDRELVQEVADEVTHAVTGDARDPDVLRSLGVKDCDCAVVAVGNDVGSSALITMRLKEAGVPQVMCKAQSHVHKRLLEKIGADRAIYPEHEMGVKVARGLDRSNVLNFIELSRDHGIVEIDLPTSWAGKTIVEVNIRAKFHVNVLAVRRGESFQVSPGADYLLEQGDRLVVLGADENVAKLGKLK